jgi:CheY-like chemotaxis protein
MPATTGSVLLVEDDRDLRDAVAEILEEEGFSVTRTENGREALDALRSHGAGEFCLVLLDMRMPVMTGIEFRREQLRDSRIAEVPVVAFAAGSRDRGEAALLGVTTFISKPVDVVPLLEVVSMYCTGEKGRDRASLPAGAARG